jgi:hypothetical protein
MVDENHAFGRRLARSQQQGMIPAGVGTGDRTRCKPASAIRFEPFQIQGPIEILTLPPLNLHIPHHPWARRLMDSYCAHATSTSLNRNFP